MPRVRMKITKGPYAGGTEWIVSDEEAAALIADGQAEPVDDSTDDHTTEDDADDDEG